jgi:FtsP/CotA-like multicopper oxidase with cupredoxin domain
MIETMISRRSATKLLGSVATSSLLPAFARTIATPDYKLEIDSVALEVSPHRFIRTTAYNGQAPGPLLRFKEGNPVTVEITNRSEHPEVVHWHGLFLPPDLDGAAEEGTPFIAPGATTRVTFTPNPSGFRWYHTHTMAMNDLSRAQYGGQHGFLMIEPRVNPASYDQEFFLGLHDWGGHLLSSDDGAMNPTYDVSTINGKTMGFGEPLRVKQGQRVLLHILNSSATEVHWIALAGHSFQVVALDGNPVPTPTKVSMLRLAPAERVCAIVEMDNPGVWVLGEVRKHVQASGMAIVVEYAGQSGRPQWQQPPELEWDYGKFANSSSVELRPVIPVTTVPLVLEAKFRGHGNMEGWTINGRSYPETAITPLKQGERYRLQFINRSLDDHPIHLHRHSFELRTLDAPLKSGNGQPAQAKQLRGLIKDTVLVAAQTQTTVEFTANNPGNTLLHCHQQNHMDLGFMMLLHYA